MGQTIPEDQMNMLLAHNSLVNYGGYGYTLPINYFGAMPGASFMICPIIDNQDGNAVGHRTGSRTGQEPGTSRDLGPEPRSDDSAGSRRAHLRSQRHGRGQPDDGGRPNGTLPTARKRVLHRAGSRCRRPDRRAQDCRKTVTCNAAQGFPTTSRGQTPAPSETHLCPRGSTPLPATGHTRAGKGPAEILRERNDSKL